MIGPGGAVIAWASALSWCWRHIRILTDDAAAAHARVLLCWCVRNVLRCGLTLLGVPALEEM